MALGLSGAYGAAEGMAALRRIQDDTLKRQVIAEQQAMELRRIVEMEARGMSDRTLGASREAREQSRYGEIERPESSQRILEGITKIEGGNIANELGRARNRTITGLSPTQMTRVFAPELEQDEVYDPGTLMARATAAGLRQGAGLKATFDSGGREVGEATEGPTGFKTMGDLTRIKAQGDQGVRLEGVRNANDIAQMNAAASLRAQGQPHGTSPYQAERQLRTIQSVDELMATATPLTTGKGALLSYLPESDARTFAGKLNTLKSSIAFGELTAMREASKTGGALGAISEKELALLENALGSLDPYMKPEAFKAELQKIKDSIERWQKVQAGGGGEGPGGVASAPKLDAAALLKKYGGG